MLIAALLLLASPSPQDFERDRDICALYALPERPGIDQMGSEEAGRRVRAITFEGWSTVLAGTVSGQAGCAHPGVIDELRFSPDGKLAFSAGGWQSGPLSGGWGECYYEKAEGKWRTLACFITAVS